MGVPPTIRKAAAVTGTASLLVGSGVLLGGLASAGPAGAAAANHIGYESETFGTSVYASGGPAQAGSQKSARTVIGCTTRPGLNVHDTTAGVNLPSPLGSVSSIADRSTTALSGGVATAGGSSQTGQVSLLGGMVTANAVTTTVSASEHENGSNPQTSANVSIVNLSVAGHAVTLPPTGVPANTSVPLPGVGTITLNAQSSTSRRGSSYKTFITDDAILIAVKSSSAPLPAGSSIVVAHAQAGLTSPLAGKLGRVAYGTSIGAVGLHSGPTFQQFMGCFGTDGKWKENHGANVTLGPLSTGAVVDRSLGIDQAGRPLRARLSSSVAGLNLPGVSPLPNPIISATLIKAEAASITNNGHTYLNETGSQIVGLNVAGHSIPNTLPPPNTTMPIPNVGTLYLNRVLRSGPNIQVRMVELVLTNSALASKLGTADLKVAVVDAKS